MDTSLVTAVIGTVAGVAAVPVAILQLRQGRSGRKDRARAGRRRGQERIHQLNGDGLRDVLRPPAGRMPVHVRGREPLLPELSVLVRLPDGQVHVLAGLGGSGKSTIALAAARQAEKAQIPAWWVSATDTESVTQSLLGLARKLGADAAEVQEALAGRPNPADVL